MSVPKEKDLNYSVLQPYVRPHGKPRAIIVDIDGTVAVHTDPVTGDPLRSHYDETMLHVDLPNPNVLRVVWAMQSQGYDVIFVSGRGQLESSWEATAAWLAEHFRRPYQGLFLRQVGDKRIDWQVKAEIFDKHIRHDYDVVAVFDDRDQVVNMWRHIGLTVLQVASGNF